MVEIYASQAEQLIQESEFESLWPQIEESDHNEIKNYVKHDCFRPKLKTECNNANFIDATWAALTLHIKDKMAGKRALLDENCFVWHDDKTEELTLATTVHVDDLFPTGRQSWLNWAHDLLEKKFGKITRKTMPFTHLGIEYHRLPDGTIFLSQDAYLDTIEAPQLDKERSK
ncbi:unnamed protein product, partial [Prorocentrum cordatum]